MKNKLPFLLSLPFFLTTGCSFVPTYRYDNASSYAEYSNPIDLGAESSGIHKLDFHWVSGAVVISHGESFKVYEDQYLGDSYLPLYYRVEGETFHLEYCKTETRNSDLKDVIKYVEITIPTSVKELSLSITSANYVVTADSLSKFSILSVSGSGYLHANSIENIAVNSVSGSFALELADSSSLSDIHANMVSGATELYFDGKKGYNLKFTSVSGNVTKLFTEGSDSSLDEFAIDFNSVSGNLLIAKLEDKEAT